MSGKISNRLPFELPADGDATLPPDRQQRNISSEHLQSMEQVYVQEVPKFKSLMTLYEMEKEKARKQGRLKRFPKTLTDWRPEGSLQSDEETESILRGLQPKALRYKEYFLDTKQHSHSYCYISKENPSRRPSTVYYHDSSSEAGTLCENLRFGVIQCLYQHTFAQKMFMWAVVSLYEDPCYNFKSGLWCSKDSFSQTVPVLLNSLSHPLTVASDGNLMWFLDVSH